MTSGGEPIAVVGLSCRVPGATDVTQFWEALAGPGRVTPVTTSSHVVIRALDPGAEAFDDALFPALEAESPQIRLLVELAHAAVEDAGYDPAAVGDGTAVYGAAAYDPGRDPAAAIARALDLRGPSVTLGTCSLTAVHLACQALRSGDCDLALAGGAHLETEEDYRWTPGGRYSPDGRCLPFGAAASGTVPGNGAAVVVLKRLSDAILEGDRIRAVIRGGALSSDGAGDDGLAVAIAEALALADCEPSDVSYVETCGTGVVPEDRAEIAAMREVYRGADSVAIGSVKANVGHLFEAAGIVGLLKVVLSLEHERIAPMPAIGAPHPGLGLGDTPFVVADAVPRPYPRVDGRPRVAGVSSRSLSGSNAHLIVTEGPRQPHAPASRRPRIVPWSAKTPAAADAARDRLAAYFAALPEESFADAVDVLQRGRTAHPVRGAVVAGGPAEAARLLRTATAERTAGPPDVTLVFPARGPARMGHGLYGAERVFTEKMDLCLEAFEQAGVDLYDAWAGGAEPTGALLFAVEYSLARTWLDWGVNPRALVGEGIGVLVADLVAGRVSFDEAIRLAAGEWDTDGRPAEAPAGPGPHILVEIGPGPAIARAGDGVHTVASLGADPADDRATLTRALARLWSLGHPVRWHVLDPDHPALRIAVPGYPYRCAATPVAAVPEPRREPVVERAAPPPVKPVPKPRPAEPEPVTGVPWLPEPAAPLKPLNHIEHAFWILEQLSPGSGVSNLSVAFRPARPVRWFPMQNAVNRLLQRHPALRLRYPEVGGVPVQHLTAPADAKLKVEVRSSTDETLTADLQEFQRRPFDLGRDLPVRVGSFTMPDGRSVICITAHHIVLDAPSFQFLMEDFCRFYEAPRGTTPPGLEGEAPLLPVPSPSPEVMEYWLKALEDVDPEGMLLPGSRPSPANPTFAGHICFWTGIDGLVQALESLRSELKVTDNIILLSAFYAMLLRHGAGPDLVVGVPVTTRRAASRRLVGYGVSTMPLRIRANPGMSFVDLVRQVEDVFFTGVENAEASVEAVLTQRGHGTGDWRVPLFRHMFNYRPWSNKGIALDGDEPDYMYHTPDRSRLDLQCVIVQHSYGLEVQAWHSTEVHDEDEVRALLRRMQTLVVEVAKDPSRAVGELELCTDEDRATMEAVNRTAREWSGAPTVLQRIQGRPRDAVAVVEGARELTYGELLTRAAAVRETLRGAGVGPGDIVALPHGRTAGMVAAVLGVWALGAAYLPLDAHQPELRLAYQVADCKARVVAVDEDDHRDLAWAGGTPVVRLPAAAPGTEPLDDVPQRTADVAYVIYTSGSTGKPKGVAVTQGNLANLVFDFAERVGGESALWSTTTSFDISALELFLPLCRGGRLVIAPDEAQLDPRTFLDLIVSGNVDVVQATPTAWRMVVPEARDELTGRTVLCGGEPMPAALGRDLLARGCTLYNVYGPTETTIWSTAAKIDDSVGDPVSIGRPLANQEAFILDPRGMELPPGVPGELCIAGDGVSAGYVERPELTAERFGEHPRYGRFYRTGDLARRRFDGELEMLGRNDRQVKLRGHRIELGEVEAVLHEHEAVRVAAVTVTGDPQTDGRLVAFVQAHPGAEAGLGEELWKYARTKLPDYAVPSGIALVDGFPTTANGKIDYKGLVDGGSLKATADTAVRAAVDGDPETVKQLVGLWRETLRNPDLGEYDNFFLHGGHSVLAVRLIGRIEEIAGKTVAVRAIFDHPNPAELAAHLAEAP
ncbi:non-ribosomal peptide synthetase [Rhizohabitans arisaemae]|uniref:non-ribosomal peptide synthetase n=1 Tax=Rhizohabitans arisaemae TaxID=2720610 RepID=UPI0024B17081|nr:non-ribosomal peptide synthetase [Rhizohabitans arisaemae]